MIGFFHFPGQERVIQDYSIPPCPVRVAITWEFFDPDKNGKALIWNNRQSKLIDTLLHYRFEPLPSIRCNNFTSRPPKDLDRGTPLQQNGVYSKTYFNFIVSILNHWQFKTIVVENEQNDEDDQWGGSVDDYIRLLLTAKSAAASVSSSSTPTLIADGGLQGDALTWIVLHELLENDFKAAKQYYRNALGEYALGVNSLEKIVKAKLKKPPVARAMEFMYKTDLYEYVDLINFHHYQLPDGIYQIVRLLKSGVSNNKPVMCNEFGMKDKYMPPSNHSLHESAAQLMTDKCKTFSDLGVSPAIWFTMPAEKRDNAGAIISGNILIPETANAMIKAIKDSR